MDRSIALSSTQEATRTKTPWLKYSALALGVPALVALSLFSIICYNQAQGFVHPTRKPVLETPDDYGLPYEDIVLTTHDEYKLAAWYLPSRNHAAIILQHGYPDNRSAMLNHAKLFSRHGYGLIMVDLRSQGESQGNTVSFGLNEVHDVEAAYQYLLSRPDVNPERIGSLGNSMGGAVVLLHAAQNSGIKAVVADSTYASLQDVIASGIENLTSLPAFPFAPMIQWFAEREAGFAAAQVAPIESIDLISPRAVFLLHGSADELIPVENSQHLFDAAGTPRELWIEPEVGHGKETFINDHADEYESRVVGFFDQYLLGN